MSALRRTVGITVRVLLWAVVLVVVAVLAAVVIVPRIMGWVPLTVLTGSMEPTIPPGSQVVVEPFVPGSSEAPQVGDIVTFMPYEGETTTVTHRVVAVATDSKGERIYTTRGDANPSADPWSITDPQLRGTVLYHVPLVGHAMNVVTSAQRGVLVWVIAGMLALWALWQFVQAVRDARRRRTDAK